MRGVPLVRALRRRLGETSMVMRLEVASDHGEARRVAELRLYAAARTMTAAPRHQAPTRSRGRRRGNRECRLN